MFLLLWAQSVLWVRLKLKASLQTACVCMWSYIELSWIELSTFQQVCLLFNIPYTIQNGPFGFTNRNSNRIFLQLFRFIILHKIKLNCYILPYRSIGHRLAFCYQKKFKKRKKNCSKKLSKNVEKKNIFFFFFNQIWFGMRLKYNFIFFLLWQSLEGIFSINIQIPSIPKTTFHESLFLSVGFTSNQWIYFRIGCESFE